MRIIPITPRKPGEAAPVNVDRVTVLGAGNLRSGKTRWAASMPRPLFLADVTEGGYTTIETMDSSLWWEPNVAPIVWGIETVADFHQGINDAIPLIASGKVKSVVADSLTFLADLELNNLFSLLGTNDNRKVYGQLGVNLRNWRVKMHSLKAHIFWATLIQAGDDEHPMPRIAVPGSQATKFGAGCDYVLEFQKRIEKGVAKHSIVTNSALGGGRDSGALPTVLPESVNTFRGFLACLQNRRVAAPLVAVEDAEAGEPAPPIAVPAAGRRVFAKKA